MDDDTPLLAAYAAGDDRAARRLAARLVPPMLRLARVMLRDAAEAEDVVQEAMLRLWKIAPDWQAGRARPESWLYRVVANLCTDRLRGRGRWAEAPEDEPEDPSPGIEVRMQVADRADAVQQALARLPERQRMAVSLRHLEELSQAEVAAIMGLGEEAVESLLARGRRGLRAILETRRDEIGLEGDMS